MSNTVTTDTTFTPKKNHQNQQGQHKRRNITTAGLDGGQQNRKMMILQIPSAVEINGINNSSVRIESITQSARRGLIGINGNIKHLGFIAAQTVSGNSPYMLTSPKINFFDSKRHSF
jgi:hypothetical protein